MEGGTNVTIAILIILGCILLFILGDTHGKNKGKK